MLQTCGNQWLFKMVIRVLWCKHCLGLHQRTAWASKYSADLWRRYRINNVAVFVRYTHKQCHCPSRRWGLRWFLSKGAPFAPEAEQKPFFSAWCMCFLATASVCTGNPLKTGGENRKAASDHKYPHNSVQFFKNMKKKLDSIHPRPLLCPWYQCRFKAT